MSTRAYYMDDAALTLPAGYRDRTTHILEWVLEGGDKIALVVQREPLPGPIPPGGSVEAFDRYVAAQTRTYPAQFPSFHLEREEASDGSASFEVRRKTFRWRYEQEVVYHNQVFVLLGTDALTFTVSSKALHRESVDGLAQETLAGLRARGEDEHR